jgi:hypothetical protein
VPVVGGLVGNLSNLANLSNIATNLGNIGSIGNLANFGNIGNMIGGFGQNNGARNTNVNGLISNAGGFGSDLSKFINNSPLDSVKANDSNFTDLINNNSDSVIKKVLKSNYN